MAPNHDRSPIELIGDIAGNVQDIVRAEVRLAAVELRTEAHGAVRVAALWGAAALVGALGLGWLLYAVIQMLALVMALWSAALVVSVATMAIAGVVAITARRRLRRIGSPLPRTRASLAEIAQ